MNHWLLVAYVLLVTGPPETPIVAASKHVAGQFDSFTVCSAAREMMVIRDRGKNVIWRCQFQLDG